MEDWGENTILEGGSDASPEDNTITEDCSNCSPSKGDCSNCSPSKGDCNNCSPSKGEERTVDSDVRLLPSVQEVTSSESLSQKIASDVVREHSCSVNYSKLPAEKKSFLTRLVESKHFDMSMAVSYLYKCKEPGVQQNIGNKLFSMAKDDAYFFLPQLVNMYTQTYEVAEILHPYLANCCRHDTVFALHTAWLLDAFSLDTSHQRKKSHGTMFKNLILSDELRFVVHFLFHFFISSFSLFISSLLFHHHHFQFHFLFHPQWNWLCF